MDASTALSVIALCISLGSLIATGLLLARQVRMMRHANELPFLVSLTNEWRSHEFQRAQYYVLQAVGKEYPAGSGFAVSNLPDDARTNVSSVISFYTILGAHLTFGLVDEDIIMSLFGYIADQSLITLEHLILEERKLRHEPWARYAILFEDLISRFRNWTHPVKTKRLPTTLNDLDLNAASVVREPRSFFLAIQKMVSKYKRNPSHESAAQENGDLTQ